MRTVDLLQEPSLSRPLKEWRCTSARRQRLGAGLGRVTGCARTVRPRALHPTVASFGDFRVLAAVASCASEYGTLRLLSSCHPDSSLLNTAVFCTCPLNDLPQALVSDDKTTKSSKQRRKRDATQCGPAKAARSQIALQATHTCGVTAVLGRSGGGLAGAQTRPEFVRAWRSTQATAGGQTRKVLQRPHATTRRWPSAVGAGAETTDNPA
jgi:hypothetical protein